MPQTDARGNSTRGTCAITGTTGYVGSRLAAHLARGGWKIREFSRSPPDEKRSQFTHVHYELGADLPPEAFDGVDALVHPAYDFSVARWPEIARVNVEGSRRLFAAARAAQVDRIVFISTLAAFPGARSLYGRAKLEIEEAAIEHGGAVVRSGLVWGPNGAAMFGALRRAVERMPIVPLFVPPQLAMTMVHEDDLALLVQRLVDRWPQGSGRLFVAASQQTPAFVDLLRSLTLQTGKKRRFVRLPWKSAWLALRTLETLGAHPPFRSDSLVSLASIDQTPFARATGSTDRYGVSFRPYAPA